MSLTKYEQETIINYNQAEHLASCYTHDKSLMLKLDRLIEKGEAITVVLEGNGWKEYNFPKKCIKVRFPRKLSEVQRQNMAERMKFMRKEDDNGMA